MGQQTAVATLWQTTRPTESSLTHMYLVWLYMGPKQLKLENKNPREEPQKGDLAKAGRQTQLLAGRISSAEKSGFVQRDPDKFQV